MSTKTISIGARESFRYTWGAGIVGGLVGGLAMGVLLHAGANMMHLIGALYGWPTVLGGWAAHLVNSVAIGSLFALLVSRPFLRNQTATVGGCVLVGVLYAAAIGLVTGGIMLPVALNVLDVQTLPEPALPLPGVLGGVLVVVSVGVAHLVYGVLLGAVYGVIHTGALGKRVLDE